MFKEKLNEFLSELINTNIKDDTETIQLRSILKLYTLFGIVAHLLIFILFLLDKDYLCALITFLYWIVLLVLIRIGDFVAVDIPKYTLLISSSKLP